MDTALIIIFFIVTNCVVFILGYIIGRYAIGCKQGENTQKTAENSAREKTKAEIETETEKARKAEQSMYHFRNLLNYNGKPQNPFEVK